MHKALNHSHTEIASHNQKQRTQAQLVHSAKKRIQPKTIGVGAYFIVHMDAKREHKFQTYWRGPMRVAGSKSHRVFEAVSIVDDKQAVLFSQCMIL